MAADKPKHTPGAIRASYAIAEKVISAVKEATGVQGDISKMADCFAEIIDRETGASRLLEALENLLQEHTREIEECSAHRYDVHQEPVVLAARKAIAKANGAI